MGQIGFCQARETRFIFLYTRSAVGCAHGGTPLTDLMFNRKKLDRERLEAYLVYLLLRVRLLIAACGLFLLVYAIATIVQSFLFSAALILAAVYLVLLSSSFEVVLWTARTAAWLATVGNRE